MEKRDIIQKQIQSLKKIREELGMNRTEFSHYMGIPLRTLEEWEAGRRQMPEYILRLIAYYVKTQQLLETKTLKLDDDVLL